MQLQTNIILLLLTSVASVFAQDLGLSHYALERYKKADINADGTISINELQTFQNWLMDNYKYIENDYVLTPAEFFNHGGGDCEDFAIVTCNLLRYYGEVAYIGCLGKTVAIQHAICLWLWPYDKEPRNMLFYRIGDDYTPDRIYIPIDYRKVGGLSAIDKRYGIAEMWLPEQRYGVEQ